MEKEECDKGWYKFLRRHWKALCLFVILAAVAAIAAVYVFLWFVEEAQITGLVPAVLNLWSMNHMVSFLLHLIFWEILYVGIPVIIAVLAVYFFWWKKIPSDERNEYSEKKLFGKHGKSRDAGNAVSLLIFIVFAILVYLDGKWNVAIASWKFDYLVYTCLSAVFWIFIIFGIPMAVGGLLYLRYELKKRTE